MHKFQNLKHNNELDESVHYDNQNSHLINRQIENISVFFENLDKDFTNIKTSLTDDSLEYHTTDLNIQRSWELPIVIRWPNSKINFQFSTKLGDICFGIAFVPAMEEDDDQNDVKVEIIEDVKLIKSGEESITGQFIIPAEGVVIFVWDNSFDWSSLKKLSYTINLFEPSFSTIDLERTTNSLQLLRESIQETKEAKLFIEHSTKFFSNQELSIQTLSDQIEDLNLIISEKLKEQSQTLQEIQEMQQVTNASKRNILSLAIRTLNVDLTRYIISFLDYERHSYELVCKYWSRMIRALRKQKSKDLLSKGKKSVTFSSSPPQTVYLDDTNITTTIIPENSALVVGNSLLKSKSNKETLVDEKMTNMKASTNRMFSLVPTIASDPQVSTKLNSSSKEVHIISLLNIARSEKHRDILCDYYESEFEKLERLECEKLRVRKGLKMWNATFEREVKRLPTNIERKELAGKMYQEYQKLSTMIKVKTEKIETSLKSLNLSIEKFLEIRNNIQIKWKYIN